MSSSCDENSDGHQVEVSTTSTATSQGKDPMWQYFELQEIDDEKGQKVRIAICQVPKCNNGKSCKAAKVEEALQGWFMTNASKHLKAFHSAAYKDMKTRKEDIASRRVERKRKLDAGQTDLCDHSGFAGGRKYGSGNMKQRAISKKLAIASVMNNWSYRLVENDAFQDLPARIGQKIQGSDATFVEERNR